MKRLGAAVCVLLTLLSTQPPSTTSAQSPQATFRSGADLVQVDVTVLDKNRRPVLGLNADDFSLQVDRTPVSIDAFAAITLPDPIGAETTPAPDRSRGVTTNQLADDGRLVVIVMDRSIPVGPPTVTAREIAKAAINTLGQGDLAAVVRTGGFVRESSMIGFTADRTKLREAIDAPNTGWVSPPAMTFGGLRESKPTLIASGDCPYGLCVLEAITHVAESLAKSPRRQRMILFIGSAILIQESARDGAQGILKAAREKALQALDRANVAVHSIDPSGLETLAPGFGFGRGTKYTIPENVKRQGDLEVLPSYTGGRAIVNTNAAVSFVTQIFDETRSYYLLGFRRDKSLDNRRREIAIRVDRKDVIVRNRQGYYPNSDSKEISTSDSLKALVLPLLPQPDLPLELGLTSGFLTSGEPEVNLLLRVGSVAVDTQATTVQTAGPFDVLVAVFDREAREVASTRYSIEPSMKSAGPVEWLGHFPLKAGRYEVRVGAREKSSGRGGSIYGYVDLPDLHERALAVSDVRMEKRATSDSSTRAWVPTLDRTFRPVDEVTASLQIRHASRGHEAVKVHVYTIDGHNARVTDETNVFEGLAFSETGLAVCRFLVPLSTLKAGEYLTTIEVSDAENRVRRNVGFRIK